MEAPHFPQNNVQDAEVDAVQVDAEENQLCCGCTEEFTEDEQKIYGQKVLPSDYRYSKL